MRVLHFCGVTSYHDPRFHPREYGYGAIALEFTSPDQYTLVAQRACATCAATDARSRKTLFTRSAARHMHVYHEIKRYTYVPLSVVEHLGAPSLQLRRGPAI